MENKLCNTSIYIFEHETWDEISKKIHPIYNTNKIASILICKNILNSISFDVTYISINHDIELLGNFKTLNAAISFLITYIVK